MPRVKIWLAVGMAGLAIAVGGGLIFLLARLAAPPGSARPAAGSRLSTTLVTDAPLAASPADQEVVTTLGSLQITTWNPVTVTGLESGTNLYFSAKNTGREPVTLQLPLPDEPGAIEVPKTLSIRHFFNFQGREITLGSGEEKTIEYLIAPDNDGQGEIPFKFQVKETSQAATIKVAVSVSGELPKALVPTSLVTGTVANAASQLVVGADVRLNYFSGRQNLRSATDRRGRFSFVIPSKIDLQAVLGARRLPYRDLDYFITVETDPGGFAYQGGVAPERGQTATVNLQLAVPQTASYAAGGIFASDGPYGYWWLRPNRDFTQLVATQGRHSPLKGDPPGHLVSLDRAGRKLWEIATKTSCWGLAVTGEGESVAGCKGDNGLIYRVSREGKTLWTSEGGGENRWAAFSPDGKTILTGPIQDRSSPRGRADAALLEAATGQVIWSYVGQDEWLRHARFSRDGERIIAGFSGGRLVMFDKAGRDLWEQRTGEFPLVLEIDDAYNVYASGKNREVVSYDRVGGLRWRYRIADHVVTAGANNIDQDGQLIVVGTVGGWLHALRADGSVAWKRQLPPLAQGHNALDMTPDGQKILVGTNGDEGGYLAVYQTDGTLAWKTRLTDRRAAADPNRGDHNDTGVITAAISADGDWLAAGTGDSTIQIFKRTSGE